MEFSYFKDKVSNLKKITLPGEEAHYKLAPLFRVQELEKKNGNVADAKNAGVLSVFYPSQENNVNFVLILRKTYKGVHSNQVGFPGGRVEKEDLNIEHTALRETEEEVGIPRSGIQILKQLTQIYIPPSNFWVFPFMGILNYTPSLIPQEDEVEDVLEIDLDEFLSDSCLTTRKLSTSYAKNVDVPAFLLNGHVVWGATAMVLSEMKDVLKQVL